MVNSLSLRFEICEIDGKWLHALAGARFLAPRILHQCSCPVVSGRIAGSSDASPVWSAKEESRRHLGSVARCKILRPFVGIHLVTSIKVLRGNQWVSRDLADSNNYTTFTDATARNLE